MSKPQDYDQQLVAWQEFVDHQKILPGVNHLVADSWRRCRLRLSPFKDTSQKCLSSDILLATQVASFDLISISRPVMEDVYQYIEGSDTAVALINSAGYILGMLGDHAMLDFAKQFDISEGTAVSEAQMGTNAFGLALIEGIPVQVTGGEHYLRRFHEWAEAAAPIFDPSGKPLGAIGLITTHDRFHPHTLGAAVAGSRAIEGQRQSDILLAEQISHLAQVNAILEASSEGVMVCNSERILMHINPAAAQMIDIPDRTLFGRHIGDFISYPKFVSEAMDKRKPLTDVEVVVDIGESSVNTVLSLRFVHDRKDLLWIIVTLRPLKDVRQLVHRQVGAHAPLTLKDIPGTSVEMRRVRRFVRSAAPATAPILIRGESGTGKNPLASAIHNESQCRDGPFLIFACSSVPSELAVAELIGYEKGVSASIPGGRPSKFELARGGTIYFQDVEALPLEAQGVLLNLIALGIVQRLGSNKPVGVDVRIIVASSADLEESIAKGNFRADLFYRLSSFEIRIPPLRERLKDLPVLSERITNRLSAQLNHKLSLDPGVMDELRKYSWPGNIRELEAVLGRAAAQAGFSGGIAPVHLPEYIHYPLELSGDPQHLKQIHSLSEVERQTILQTARLCSGNVSQMARILGVGRTTIWRKLKAFDVSPEDFRQH